MSGLTPGLPNADRQPEGRIESEASLTERLTTPTPELVRDIVGVQSPLVVLGAGGKMGPTLAVLARRAARLANHPLEVVAVSRFSEAATRPWLENHGVRTVAADLLRAQDVANLPDATHVVHLAGLKFGTAQNPAATWAMNTLVPGRVLERYPEARWVVLSTGNVYPLTRVADGGALEDGKVAPVGEYANAALARERLFEFASQQRRTRVALLRLFYAVELRYGILADLARLVFGGEPIPLANGAFNCIWQRDANEFALRAFGLAASPPTIWNLCQPQVFSVRDVATRLGALLGRAPCFTGTETDTALLGNPARLCRRLGNPRVGLDSLLPWIADWVRSGGRSLNKPTHFEVRDGQF